jgi:hypothetical protein
MSGESVKYVALRALNVVQGVVSNHTDTDQNDGGSNQLVGLGVLAAVVVVAGISAAVVTNCFGLFPPKTKQYDYKNLPGKPQGGSSGLPGYSRGR